MKPPKSHVQEYHQDDWWPSGYSDREANVSTLPCDTICLMVTTQPWSTIAEQPGVRTDKTPMRFKVHLR